MDTNGFLVFFLLYIEMKSIIRLDCFKALAHNGENQEPKRRKPGERR